MKSMSNDGTTMVSPRVTPRRVAYDVVKGSSSNYEVANEKSVAIRFLNMLNNQLATNFALAMIDNLIRLMES